MNTSTHRRSADVVPKLHGMGAIVTGGPRGIGRSMVERLLADGTRVAFSCLSGAEPAAELERKTATDGGAAWPLRLAQAAKTPIRQFSVRPAVPEH
ncbi:SDR family NAD(P)-dependent oxidoreductase [Streptacidiphilus sp. ASG 303]|uniref:SDR family NAD(P)-dependent oxidoreductase n=1 Tax=Streptacidiphilus sp. ASG 303 TaxID=2896847 RepID=UPI0027DFAD80|nr:SDR family NAD(P)-dependent oxidoreductase [Streptacidiphilus sp. ASG 303]